jgi:hypothetical protein
MANLSPLDRQLTAVSRRLYMQTFLDRLVWCWSGALVLASVWFFAESYLLASPADWLKWAVAGGLLAVATALAGGLAVLAAPSRLIAALSLDERFGLRERVTTSLTLGAGQASSPAGQALLADVNQRIGSLDVRSKFPVSMSRSAFVVPVCATIFACVALLYEPPKTQALTGPTDEGKQPIANVAKVDEAMKKLAKKPIEKAADKPKTEEIERLEAKLEEIANRPRKTKDELRERVKEMKALEDRMRKRENELASKLDNRDQALKKLDKMNEGAKDGPAKDLQKALSQGNMDQAKDALEKLSKKIDQMSEKDKEKLAKQLKEMEEKLKRLADNKEKKEELEKLKKDGKLSDEAFEREMKDLEKQGENLKDLQDLADKMGQCKKCLEQGDAKGAKQKMQDAADKMKELGADDETLEDLREQMKRLQDAKKAGKNGSGEGKDDNGDPQPNDTDQPNDGGIGAGRRAQGGDVPTKSFETKARTPFDAKGKKIFDGYAPGQNFRKKSTSEIIEDIEQARQESSEAIETQRIPKAARDMAKGYFKNLGGQEGGKKPAPAPAPK